MKRTEKGEAEQTIRERTGKKLLDSNLKCSVDCKQEEFLKRSKEIKCNHNE